MIRNLRKAASENWKIHWSQSFIFFFLCIKKSALSLHKLTQDGWKTFDFNKENSKNGIFTFSACDLVELSQHGQTCESGAKCFISVSVIVLCQFSLIQMSNIVYKKQLFTHTHHTETYIHSLIRPSALCPPAVIAWPPSPPPPAPPPSGMDTHRWSPEPPDLQHRTR